MIVTSRIIHNIFHLSLVKGLELMFPLMSIPLLIKGLGLHAYGELVFIQTITAYLQIIVNYGFDEFGTRTIATANSKDERAKVAINILSVKLAITFVVAFFYFPIIFFIVQNKILYFSFFLLLICDVVNLYWFYQGIENFRVFSVASVVSKIVYLLGIYIFIHEPDDIFLVPITQAVTFVFGNLYSFIVFYRYHVSYNFCQLDRKYFFCYLKSSGLISLSNILNAFKDKAGNIIVGVFVGREALAMYDIINKMMLVLNQPATIIITALFPTFSKSHDKIKMFNTIKWLIVLSTIIFISSFPFVWFVLPKVYEKFIPFLSSIQISVLSCYFYAISFFIGRNVLVARLMSKELLWGVLATSSFYLSCLFFLGFSAIGYSVMSLVTLSVATYLFEALVRGFLARKYLCGTI